MLISYDFIFVCAEEISVVLLNDLLVLFENLVQICPRFDKHSIQAQRLVWHEEVVIVTLRDDLLSWDVDDVTAFIACPRDH